MGEERDRHRPPARRKDKAVAPLPKPDARDRYPVLAVCGLLLLAVALVFGQTLHYGFLNYDDDAYVFENPHVLRGLGMEEVCWAFTDRHTANWIPLCWISLILDRQIYGPGAGGYHFSNVLLHAATAIALFLVLRSMTRRLWPSAAVAALFALHPLRVESVAWVTERKDVLSGLLFMLTLAAYVSYARHRFSLLRYLAVVVLFALALMAKAAVVTLPPLLLLLDYWPLGRMGAEGDKSPAAVGGSWTRSLGLLVLEKLPLLALAAASSAVATWAAGDSLIPCPLESRIANVMVHYVGYLGQLFYPVGLGTAYVPPAHPWPVTQALAAFLLLAAVTAVAVLCVRRRPYLLIGWLWYLGMSVPIIGLVPLGMEATANRFTYLTQIGLCVALVWSVADLGQRWSHGRWLYGLAAVPVLGVLMLGAWRQTGFWRDNETLWPHALACTSENWLAHNNLGLTLARRGELDEAMGHFRQAFRLKPDFANAYNNLGLVLLRRERFDDAYVQFQKSVEIEPRQAATQYNLANALAARGRLDEAVAHYQMALKLKPDEPRFYYCFAVALAQQGRLDEAIEQYGRVTAARPDKAQACCHLAAKVEALGNIRQAIGLYKMALKVNPDCAEAHNNLARLLATCPDAALGSATPEAYCQLAAAVQLRGNIRQTIELYKMALKVKPDYVEAHNNLAWLLATGPDASLRSASEAIAHARRAEQLCGGRQPVVLDTLAAAYAEAGRFPEASATARRALALATQQNDAAAAGKLRRRLALYEAGKPYHEPPSPSAPAPKR
jgi:tetratricopeptide (TPR) repeat protein